MADSAINSLALVARPTDGTLNRNYTAWYAPNTGDYVIACRQGTFLTYTRRVNEQEFFKAWEDREEIQYLVQAPPGIDYGIIALLYAVLDSSDATIDSGQEFVQNVQDNTAANQAQLQKLQEIYAKLPDLVNGHAKVMVDVPVTLSGDMLVHGHVTVDNPTTHLTVDNFPATQHVVVDNQPAVQTVHVDNFPVASGVQHVLVDNPPTTYPVTGNFWQSVQPVSAKFWQDVQPVSGPLTDAALRASPVQVSFPMVPHMVVDSMPAISGTVNVGNFPTTQPVSGSVAISNFPTTQHVTLDNPATSISINNLPATQQVAGSVSISNPVTTVAVSSLPAGYGTSGNQLIANVSLNSIDGKLTNVSNSTLQAAGNASVASVDTKLNTTNGTLSSIDGKLGASLLVKSIAGASVGISTRKVIGNAANTAGYVIKNTPCQLYNLVMANVGTALCFVALFDKATAPVAGDIPVAVYPVAAGVTEKLAFPMGAVFSNGLACSITSGLPLLGVLTALLTANQTLVNAEYV